MKYLKLKEAAEKLQVNPKVVKGLIESGELKAKNICQGAERKFWRIKEEWIEEYMDPTPVAPPVGRKSIPTGINRY